VDFSEPTSLAILIAVGVVAGIVNTMSGGGSMLTVGTLMAMGMPANVANATNRIPILFQSTAGVAGYAKNDLLDLGESLRFIPLVVLGAIGGSLAAGLMDNRNFEPILIACMLGVALYMLFGGGAKTSDADEGEKPAINWLSGTGLVVAGFYGGLVQAGVGLILLTVLSGLLRIDLTRANGFKLVAVNITNIISFGIFLWQGLVEFLPGLAMAVGTTAGAFVGVRLSVRDGDRWIRFLAMTMAIVTILYAAFR
jgi:uncharacterized membrane protein YfcA